MAQPVDDQDQAMPAYIEETIARIARLHARHRQGAAPIQRGVEAATRFVGRPRFAGLAAVAMALWAGAHAALRGARSAGRLPSPDPGRILGRCRSRAATPRSGTSIPST